MNLFRRFAILFVLVLLLSACCSGLKPGDQRVAKENIVVVIDYNALSIRRCSIPSGTQVTVIDASSLYEGAHEWTPLLQLSSTNCTGWAIDDSSLLGKLSNSNN